MSPDPELTARTFTRWFLMQNRGKQADFIRSVWPRLGDLLGRLPDAPPASVVAQPPDTDNGAVMGVDPASGRDRTVEVGYIPKAQYEALQAVAEAAVPLLAVTGGILAADGNATLDWYTLEHHADRLRDALAALRATEPGTKL